MKIATALPRPRCWIDRILPKISVEGQHHTAPVPASELEDEGGEGRPKEPELV